MGCKSVWGILLTVAVVLSVALTGCSTSSSQPELTAITLSPSMPAMDVGSTVTFNATGHFRGGSTRTLAGVVWSSSDPSVISIDASGSATARMSGASAATITATLGSMRGSTQVNVKAPVVIDVTPALPVVTIGGNQAFQATGKFADLTTADLTSFVTWSSSSNAIATIGADGVATGMGRGIATITAGNSGVNGSAAFNVTDKSFSNASLSGSYALTLTGFAGSRPVFESGSIHADGNGAITGGIEDINSATPATGVALTGSYSITPDGRGILTLTGNDQMRSFNVILKANSPAAGDTNAQIIQNDGQANAIGRLEKQDTSAFNNAAFGDSNYVFRAGGISSAGNISALGWFTTDSAGGTLSGGQDVNDAGTLSAYVPISGTLDSVDTTTGRATANIAGSNFAVYVVSANKANLIQIDLGRPAVMGIAERQTATAAPASGAYTFDVEIGGTQGMSWLIGQFDFDGMDVLGGSQIQDGYVSITVNPGANDFCITDANGRGYLIEDTGHGLLNFVVYIVSPEKMYIASSDPHAASGTAELQQPGEGFSLASLSGDFALGAAETGEGQLTFVGQFVFDGNGNFYAVDDLSEPGFVGSAPLLGGTYTVSSNGATTMTLPPGAKVPSLTLFLISPNKGLFLGTPEPDVNGVAEAQ
ncbi:MAG TPA: Ig-like domain-containing protein [Terriglobales bacterium]|jgi:hypothetical protein|nr:Ig-like domain-containing protein [Terriglobales bacterium]